MINNIKALSARLALVAIILLSSLCVLIVAKTEVVKASSMTFNYTYGMDAYRRGFCRRAVNGGDASLQNIRDRCWWDVNVYCATFRTQAYQWGCIGKWFELDNCVQTGTSSMIQMGIQHCKNSNTFRCHALPNADLKNRCIEAGRRDQFGIIIQNSDGSTTPAGGGTTTNPQAGGDIASQIPTEETADTDEDTALTEEEIAAQAQQLREDLSRGTNECGGSKTVFDFNCENVDNPILALLFGIIKFVTYGIGIIITLAIVISGIQYATAQGDPGTVKKARTRIFNAVVALLLYLFSFAILNYLVPGGLIG